MATQVVAFLGATRGIGLSALTHTLAAGHTCIALCRTPSKLTEKFPAIDYPNLHVMEGNAHDVDAVTRLVTRPNGQFVDKIVTTIGFTMKPSKLSIEDNQVCRKGMITLLESLDLARKQGLSGKPRLIVCSTTGISKYGRDIPLLYVPLYHGFLKSPHDDKKFMEEKLLSSSEDFTIVRPSFLTNSVSSDKKVRTGIEDPRKGRESSAVGYTISREAAGRWIAENLAMIPDAAYLNKVVMITH